MTWVILLSGAFLLVWVVTGGLSLAVIALSVALLSVLGVVWHLSQPPWRQGRGMRLRRMKYVDVPFKTPNTPTSGNVT
jgi:hypothetical protein